MLIHAATENDIHPPLAGGTQRSFGLYRGLAREHRVEALCLVENRNRAPRETNAAGVRILRRKAWYTSAAWRLEQARIAPLFLLAYGHAAAARALAREFSGAADALLADLHLTGLFAADPSPLKVYTSHNVELDHFAGARPRVAAREFWTARLRDLEARAVGRAGLTVVCAEEDAARMCELYGARSERLVVIPNGYDETLVRPPSEGERARARAALGVSAEEYVALFVGSDFSHNRAALAWLLDRVMPALAGDGFRLLVAGSVTRALAGRRESWLLARAEAPDLAPVLHAADAGLNPVSRGGGSNVKVPTYLAAGLAVITTPFGLRGYASLSPCVVTAGLTELADALHERPAGWRARGAALPDA
ncbi:MAG TPA: glycosyltransferase, partial [Terriglobales bacterium]|nr:glycosyltransferase [Terriglobales bacterium]